MPLPIVLTDDERQELLHRLNNPIDIASSAAQLGMDSESPEDRNRFRAILTALKRLQEEHKEIFGL